jgi:hypothetical protein
MDDTEIRYSQNLLKENFVDWFIEEFYTFNFECIEFVIKQFIFTNSNETTTKSLHAHIKIVGQFDCNIFLNRTGYLKVHYIDFLKKEIIGYIYEENFSSVFKPEIYNQLIIILKQYGK